MKHQKFFVSLLDLPRQSRWWPLIESGAHDKWSEMRTLEPKGKLIHYYYAFSIPGMENKISEMESLLAELGMVLVIANHWLLVEIIHS